MKNSSRAKAVFCSILFLGAGLVAKTGAAPVLHAEAQAGPLFSLTGLPGMSSAIQSGWDAKISLSLETLDVFTPMGVAAGGGTSGMPAFSARLEAMLFALGQSPIQADGSLYRAWQGMGLSLLGGIRGASFLLPLARIPSSFRLEAGGGLRATKYTGTGLVSANPAIVGQAGLDIQVSSKVALGISLPLEFAWKSGGTSFMFGLGAALRYR